MDETARMDPALLPRLFEMGLMGVEVPERLGGGGGTFFHSVLVVEELSRVDPSVGVLVDVQNTLVINALLRWATDRAAAHVAAATRRRRHRRLCVVGSGVGQRRVCVDHACRALTATAT